MILGGGGLITKLCLTLATPWTAACRGSLSMGFPRQEYQSGMPFPSPQFFPLEKLTMKTISDSFFQKQQNVVEKHSVGEGVLSIKCNMKKSCAMELLGILNTQDGGYTDIHKTV